MALDYRKCAREIVDHVGGSGNIAEVTHCATRLNLVVRNSGKIDRNGLENIDGISEVVGSKGKLQLTIGSAGVNKVYSELMTLTGLAPAAEEAVSSAEEEKTSRSIPAFVPVLLFIGIFGLLAVLAEVPGKNIPALTSMSKPLLYVIMLAIAAAVSCVITLIIRRAGSGSGEAAGRTSSASSVSSSASAAPAKVPDKVVMSCSAGEIKAVTFGKTMPRERIPDETFASGVLGEGVAIDPTDDVVYAPFDGTVSTVAEAKHALGLTGPGGMELLIHIGVDTVAMSGDGFSVLVKEGDAVKVGQKLAEFDRKKLSQAGYADYVVMLLTNADEYADLKISL